MMRYVLYRAIAKYGADSFSFQTIEKIEAGDETELTKGLNERERYWIAQYRSHSSNGYNMTDGGSDSPKIRSYRVIELNYDGTVIGVYDSATDAGDIRQTKSKNIQHGCTSNTHYCKLTDSFWYYEHTISDSKVALGDKFSKQKKSDHYFQPGNLIGSKRVAEYSRNGELLGLYDSIEDAGRLSHVSESSIRRILQRKTDYVKDVTFIQVS